ncbi:MAG TPA: EamA family transporter [Gemmatimonadaceae bacterium]
MSLRSPVALFTISTLIWGSTWLAIKFQLGVVSPEVSVAYRFALGAIVLAAWCLVTGRSLRFDLRQHAYVALQGFLMFGLNYVGVYYAERYAASGLVAVIFSTIVFMNPVGARWLFGTAVTLRTLVAAVLGVVGVALLFVPELTQARHGGEIALGFAFGIGSTMIASAGNMAAMRNQRASIPVLSSTAWGMLYGAATAAIMALIADAPWTVDLRAPYIVSLAYLAVFGSVIAFGSYLTLLKMVGPGPASYVGVTTPIVAMLASTLFEGYRWTALGAFGVVLAMAGNWLALKPVRRPVATSARASISPEGTSSVVTHRTGVPL